MPTSDRFIDVISARHEGRLRLVLLLLSHLPVPYPLPLLCDIIPHGVPPRCRLVCLAGCRVGNVRLCWSVLDTTVLGVRRTSLREPFHMVRATRVARGLQPLPPSRAYTRICISGDCYPRTCHGSAPAWWHVAVGRKLGRDATIGQNLRICTHAAPAPPPSHQDKISFAVTAK